MTEKIPLCPVMQVIGEIRGGGLYMDEGSDQVIIIGGTVYDEVNYYLMSRKIAIARFKLGRPNDAQIARMIADMYGPFEGKTYEEILPQIPAITVIKSRARDMLDSIIDLLSRLDQTIINYVQSRANVGKSVTMSINSYSVDISCDDHNQLMAAVNTIINYVNIDLSSDIIMPKKCERMTEMGGEFNGKTIFSGNSLEVLLSNEEIICARAMEIEKYYALCMQRLNCVIDYIMSIIDKLNTTNTISI